jgi:hypothetical protein
MPSQTTLKKPTADTSPATLKFSPGDVARTRDGREVNIDFGHPRGKVLRIIYPDGSMRLANKSGRVDHRKETPDDLISLVKARGGQRLESVEAAKPEASGQDEPADSCPKYPDDDDLFFDPESYSPGVIALTRNGDLVTPRASGQDPKLGYPLIVGNLLYREDGRAAPNCAGDSNDLIFAVCGEDEGHDVAAAGLASLCAEMLDELDTTIMGLSVQDGYTALGRVLRDALAQAQSGKGKERHARGNLCFIHQPILEIGRMLGTPAGQMFQAMKKTQEAAGLLRKAPEGVEEPFAAERAIRELLGAINYLAAAVIQISEDVDATDLPF